jgi:hypothetical protein
LGDRVRQGIRSVGQPLGAIGLAAALSFTAPALLAAPVAAPTPAPAPAAQNDSIQSAERSVVRVVTVSLDAVGQPIGMDTGSGFVVAPGLVVTNHHMVVGSAQAVTSETFVIPERDAGGQSMRAQTKQTWTDADLALLAAPGLTSPPLTISLTQPGKEATVRAPKFCARRRPTSPPAPSPSFPGSRLAAGGSTPSSTPPRSIRATPAARLSTPAAG